MKISSACLSLGLAALLFVAAPYVAGSAGRIARLSGLTDTFIGTTLVAFATSLPEIATCLTALKIGAFSLLVGNIFGSNAFNMVLLVPLDAIADGPLLANVSPNSWKRCRINSASLSISNWWPPSINSCFKA